MNSLRLTQQLIIDEGLRLKPYHCTAGKLTIGVGRNLDDRGITEAEALALLDNDIKNFWDQLILAQPWVVLAPEAIQEALLNMAFNLGISGLLGFKNTLALMQTRDYAHAASAMLDSIWAHQVGQRATRLAEQVQEAKN